MATRLKRSSPYFPTSLRAIVAIPEFVTRRARRGRCWATARQPKADTPKLATTATTRNSWAGFEPATSGCEDSLASPSAREARRGHMPTGRTGVQRCQRRASHARHTLLTSATYLRVTPPLWPDVARPIDAQSRPVNARIDRPKCPVRQEPAHGGARHRPPPQTWSATIPKAPSKHHPDGRHGPGADP